MTGKRTPLSEAQSARLKQLILANKALAQVDSLDELLPQLLQLAQEVTESVGASFLLYNEKRNTLSFVLARNEFLGTADRLISAGLELKLGEGIAGYVAQTRKSLVIVDAQNDPRFCPDFDKKTGFVTRSILTVPIIHHERLLGVVQVVNPRTREHFGRDDLELLESFAHLAAVALVRAELLTALLQQERVRAQLDAAARIQSHFLPELPELAGGSSIWAQTIAAVYVGGDFYDCVDLGAGRTMFAIGDVSGKGLPAALVGAAMWARLRAMASSSLDTGTLMAELNREMDCVLRSKLFVTCVLGVHEPGGVCRFANAGHPLPVLRMRDEVREVPMLCGPPLGVDLDAYYEEYVVHLGSKESLLFVTDGVTEARGPDREFFGEERVQETVARTSSPPYAPVLMEELEKWLDGRELVDDVTVLEIWR